MTDPSKIKPSHTQRAAYVYIRQSTPGQVEHNRESTARQYALADRACQLGWSKEQVVLIDEDLGLSGSGTDKRSGFARLTSEVALAHVGIVLGLEVSRLARNNADWYRLLELCGITDTLIGDNDGVYHPALFNDRLLLGLKGPCQRPNCTSFALDWMAVFATKPLAVNCGGACPWATSGEIRTVKFSFIRMRLSPARSAPFSSDSLNSARRDAYGSGFVPKVCPFHCKPRPADYRVQSAGLFRPTQHFTTSSAIRCMLALTPTARPSANATLMNTAPSENVVGICRWISGPFSFRTTILASSIGRPIRPIRRDWIPTLDPGRISQEVP